MRLFRFLHWPFGYLLVLLFSEDSWGQNQNLVWTTAYSMVGNHEIAQNSLLTTLPKMTRGWKVTFEVNPTSHNSRSYVSLLHLTIGGKGTGSGAKIGDRNPSIWFHKTKGVLISSALNGKVSYSKFHKNLPPIGEWTKIEVSQSLDSSKYIYSITIGSDQVLSIQNTKPVELSNVKVFAGSPWYSPQRGSIRNLKIELQTPIDCLEAGDKLSTKC